MPYFLFLFCLFFILDPVKERLSQALIIRMDRVKKSENVVTGFGEGSPWVQDRAPGEGGAGANPRTGIRVKPQKMNSFLVIRKIVHVCTLRLYRTT